MSKRTKRYSGNVTPLRCPRCGEHMDIIRVEQFYAMVRHKNGATKFITLNIPKVFYEWECEYCGYPGPRTSASAWVENSGL